MKQRLDQLLVDRNLAASLKLAQALIMAGKVIIDDTRIDKPGTLVKSSSHIRIKMSQKFVSRGGLKLEGAIKDLHLENSFCKVNALDVGSSTGGFTDCLLKYGAAHVYALDVGTNQLAWSLRSDRRVTSIEKTDFRDLSSHLLVDLDWVVADISFNSLTNFVSSFYELKSSSKALNFLLLVKPQFELKKELIPEGGVITDKDLINQAVYKVKKSFIDKGFNFISSIPSRISGMDGNKEVFLYLKL